MQRARSRECWGRFFLLLALSFVGFAALTFAPRHSLAAGGFGPSYRSCGSFQAEYKIHVYASHVSCRRAMRIQKEYWLAPPSRTHEVITKTRPYVVLKRFPGWKCYYGSGGGECVKGRKVAAYTDI
jgi:hypothetical protein